MEREPCVQCKQIPSNFTSCASCIAYLTGKWTGDVPIDCRDAIDRSPHPGMWMKRNGKWVEIKPMTLHGIVL